MLRYTLLIITFFISFSQVDEFTKELDSNFKTIIKPAEPGYLNLVETTSPSISTSYTNKTSFFKSQKTDSVKGKYKARAFGYNILGTIAPGLVVLFGSTQYDWPGKTNSIVLAGGMGLLSNFGYLYLDDTELFIKNSIRKTLVYSLAFSIVNSCEGDFKGNCYFFSSLLFGGIALTYSIWMDVIEIDKKVETDFNPIKYSFNFNSENQAISVSLAIVF